MVKTLKELGFKIEHTDKSGDKIITERWTKIDPDYIAEYEIDLSDYSEEDLDDMPSIDIVLEEDKTSVMRRDECEDFGMTINDELLYAVIRRKIEIGF